MADAARWAVQHTLKAVGRLLENGEAKLKRKGKKNMNPIVHFEMPYDNRMSMAKFYESAFGWRIKILGEEMGNYVLATTTETD